MNTQWIRKSIAVSALVLTMGTAFADSSSAGSPAGYGMSGAYGQVPGMMGYRGVGPAVMGAYGMGPGMMGAYGMGPSMMGYYGMGPGMMGAYGMGPNMMGYYQFSAPPVGQPGSFRRSEKQNRQSAAGTLA